MDSLWTDTAKAPSFPALERDIRTDVLIIGGGMAGVLCAQLLHRAGVDYVLAEADTVGGGITKNTTAKVTSQHGLLYAGLAQRFGLEKAGQYLEANEDALERFRVLGRAIDCDFEEKSAFVYTVNDRKKLERELGVLRALGYPATLAERLPLPFSTAGGVCFPRQAQFHPLKFLYGVSKGLRIYEHTAVRELIGTDAVTDRGRIAAKKVIVTTHFPMLNKHGSFYLKLYQHRSYVLALENAPDVGGMYVDDEMRGMSFRNAGKLLLIGGGDHRTGKKGGGWQELSDFAKLRYPGAAEKYRWATQDCMSLDGVPYIGRYSARTENLYVASGFNKWGMTSSMAAAALLCDLVRERENPYEALFSPSRSILRPQLAVNAAGAVANLLTPSAPRCPHLGCALKWNPAERSWDCPCHGSRFAEDGTLLDNPAAGDLKRRKER